jgi:hypothetical protein
METNMNVTVRDIAQLVVIVAGLVREGVTFEVDKERGSDAVWVIRLTGGF